MVTLARPRGPLSGPFSFQGERDAHIPCVLVSKFWVLTPVVGLAWGKSLAHPSST
jgi:hypothetical protein